MKCIHCHHQCGKSDNFCRACGRLLDGHLDGYVTRLVADKVREAERAAKKKAGGAISMGLLILGLFGYRQIADVRRSADEFAAEFGQKIEARLVQRLDTFEKDAARRMNARFERVAEESEVTAIQVAESLRSTRLGLQRLSQDTVLAASLLQDNAEALARRTPPRLGGGPYVGEGIQTWAIPATDAYGLGPTITVGSDPAPLAGAANGIRSSVIVAGIDPSGSLSSLLRASSSVPPIDYSSVIAPPSTAAAAMVPSSLYGSTSTSWSIGSDGRLVFQGPAAITIKK